MPEQVWYHAWGFFALGIVGFIIRVLFTFVRSGQRKLTLFDEYVENNSAVVLLGFLFYCGLVSLWKWSDAFSFFPEWVGIVPHVLNAWTIAIGFAADVLFMLLVDKVGQKIGADKLGDKVAGLVPKVGKQDEQQTPQA